MSRAQTKRHSPLFIWKLVLIAVILGVGILSNIDPVQVELETRRAELPRKLTKIEPSEGETRVVFFGNSLLQYALPPEEQNIAETLNRIASRRGPLRNPIKVVNLARDRRTTWDIERRGDQILALRPSAIVIQADMIINRKRVEPRGRRQNLYVSEAWERLQNWARFLKAPLMQQMASGKRQRENDEQLLNALSSQAQIDIQILKKADNKEKTLEQRQLERVREVWTGQIISTSSKAYVRSRSFIKRAQENGITVIVLETPVSTTAAQFATQDYLNQREVAVHELLASDSDFYVRFPRVLADDCFHDYSHLNPKGQRVFFRWLAPVLVDKLTLNK